MWGGSGVVRGDASSGERVSVTGWTLHNIKYAVHELGDVPSSYQIVLEADALVEKNARYSDLCASKPMRHELP